MTVKTKRKLILPFSFMALALLLIAAPASSLQAEPKPPKSPIVKYIEALLKMQVKSVAKSGVKMQINVVPDAYLYFMAKKYEECLNFGFDEDLTVGKLKRAHIKYKRFQNRLYFKIHIA